MNRLPSDLARKVKLGFNIIRYSRGPTGKVSAVFLVARLARQYLARRISGISPQPPASLVAEGDPARPPGRNTQSDSFFRELTHPVGIYRYEMLRDKFSPTPVVLDEALQPSVNFLLPTIDRRILFGGYHAAYRFIDALLARGHRVRLLVMEPSVPWRDKIMASFSEDPFMFSVLERCEIHLRTNPRRPIRFHPDDALIAYSWETARMAHDFARELGRPFIYFIQEFEAIFQPHDSIHFLIEDTYSLPHFAIFNSSLLQDYFRRHRIGVYAAGDEAGEANSAAFAHALSPVRSPTLAELQARKTRKLLAYTRPEAHAGRNLFEIVIMALNRAIEDGIFDGEEWEFRGIGTLALESGYRLAGGRTLNMLPRMDINAYARMVGEHDVGVCLMLAPHPSVPPFEMAAAGLSTVTTGFDNRSAEVMSAISENLIAADHSIDSVVAALKGAVARVDDFEGRVRGAAFGQTTDWADSFSDGFFGRLPLHVPRRRATKPSTDKI